MKGWRHRQAGSGRGLQLLPRRRRQAVYEACDAVVQRDDAARASSTSTSGIRCSSARGFRSTNAFTPGDYQLEIKITDKTNNQTITRNVPFTVTYSRQRAGRRVYDPMDPCGGNRASRAWRASCVRAVARPSRAATRFPAGSIEGRVLDDAQAPSPARWCRWSAARRPPPPPTATGRYTLRELPFGPYILSVHSRGYWQVARPHDSAHHREVLGSRNSARSRARREDARRSAVAAAPGADRAADPARGIRSRRVVLAEPVGDPAAVAAQPRCRAIRQTKRQAKPPGGCGTFRAAS